MARKEQRTTEQKELALAELSKLMRRGVSKREAARRLGVDPKQVRRDWQELCRRLAREEAKDKAAILAEYAEVKGEAWDAWERSKLNRERTTAEKTTDAAGDGTSKTKAVKVVEGRLPENSYLETIRKVLDKECELNNLNPPTKIAPTTPDGKDQYTGGNGPLLAALLRAAAEVGAAGDPGQPDAGPEAAA